MTVPPFVYSCLLYGAIGLVVGGVVIMYRRDGRPKLPDAVVHGGPSRALRRWAARVAPWIMVGVGVVAAIWLDTQAYEAVIVTDDGAKPSARRAVRLGAIAPDDSDPSDHVWVVNRSTHAVRIEPVQYGIALPAAGHAVVPPGATRGIDSIDYIGPDDPPPTEIRVTAGVPMDSRNWLTWD